MGALSFGPCTCPGATAKTEAVGTLSWVGGWVTAAPRPRTRYLAQPHQPRLGPDIQQRGSACLPLASNLVLRSSLNSASDSQNCAVKPGSCNSMPPSVPDNFGAGTASRTLDVTAGLTAAHKHMNTKGIHKTPSPVRSSFLRSERGRARERSSWLWRASQMWPRSLGIFLYRGGAAE